VLKTDYIIRTFIVEFEPKLYQNREIEGECDHYNIVIPAYLLDVEAMKKAKDG